VSRTIYKYPITPDENGEVLIAAGGTFKLLTVQMRDSVPCLWAEVDPDSPIYVHRFVTVGTGRRIPDDGVYVGSWQNGRYVWHLYDRGIT
jgi:hypothetical protein